MTLEEIADFCRAKGVSELALWSDGTVSRIVMGPAPMADATAIAATEPDPVKAALEAKRARYSRMFGGRAMTDEQIAGFP